MVLMELLEKLEMKVIKVHLETMAQLDQRVLMDIQDLMVNQVKMVL